MAAGPQGRVGLGSFLDYVLYRDPRHIGSIAQNIGGIRNFPALFQAIK